MEDKIKKAKAAGYSDEEIAKFLGTKKTSGLENTMRQIGLGGIYDVGKQGVGFGQMAIGGISKNPQMMSQGYQNVSEAQQKFGFADPRSQGNQFNPVQYATQTAKDAAGLAPWLAGGSGGLSLARQAGMGGSRGLLNAVAQEDVTPGRVIGQTVGGAIAEPSFNAILRAIPYLTKGQVIKKTNEAVAKATAEGKGMTFDDLSQLAENKVKAKLGWTNEVRKAFNSTIVEKTPASIEPGAGKFDPQQMLDWRRQIQARQGSGIFNLLQKGSDIQGKVDSIIRSTVSENLHKLAPESIKPDKLYSLYSRGGKLIEGDIPTKLLKIGAATIAWNKLPYILRNMLGAGIGDLK